MKSNNLKNYLIIFSLLFITNIFITNKTLAFDNFPTLEIKLQNDYSPFKLRIGYIKGDQTNDGRYIESMTNTCNASSNKNCIIRYENKNNNEYGHLYACTDTETEVLYINYTGFDTQILTCNTANTAVIQNPNLGYDGWYINNGIIDISSIEFKSKNIESEDLTKSKQYEIEIYADRNGNIDNIIENYKKCIGVENIPDSLKNLETQEIDKNAFIQELYSNTGPVKTHPNMLFYNKSDPSRPIFSGIPNRVYDVYHSEQFETSLTQPDNLKDNDYIKDIELTKKGIYTLEISWKDPLFNGLEYTVENINPENYRQDTYREIIDYGACNTSNESAGILQKSTLQVLLSDTNTITANKYELQITENAKNYQNKDIIDNSSKSKITKQSFKNFIDLPNGNINIQAKLIATYEDSGPKEFLYSWQLESKNEITHIREISLKDTDNDGKADDSDVVQNTQTSTTNTPISDTPTINQNDIGGVSWVDINVGPPVEVTAQAPFFNEEGKKYKSLGDYLTDFYLFSLWLIAAISVIMIIIGGYTIITSSGNPDGVTKGRGMIMSALIALALLVLAFVILRIISPQTLSGTLPDAGTGLDNALKTGQENTQKINDSAANKINTNNDNSSDPTNRHNSEDDEKINRNDPIFEKPPIQGSPTFTIDF